MEDRREPSRRSKTTKKKFKHKRTVRPMDVRTNPTALYEETRKKRSKAMEIGELESHSRISLRRDGMLEVKVGATKRNFDKKKLEPQEDEGVDKERRG